MEKAMMFLRKETKILTPNKTLPSKIFDDPAKNA